MYSVVCYSARWRLWHVFCEQQLVSLSYVDGDSGANSDSARMFVFCGPLKATMRYARQTRAVLPDTNA